MENKQAIADQCVELLKPCLNMLDCWKEYPFSDEEERDLEGKINYVEEVIKKVVELTKNF